MDNLKFTFLFLVMVAVLGNIAYGSSKLCSVKLFVLVKTKNNSLKPVKVSSTLTNLLKTESN